MVDYRGVHNEIHIWEEVNGLPSQVFKGLLKQQG